MVFRNKFETKFYKYQSILFALDDFSDLSIWALWHRWILYDYRCYIMLYYYHMKKQYFHSFINTDIIYNSNYVAVKRLTIIDYQLRTVYTADKDYIRLAISVDIFSSNKPITLCFLYQYNNIIVMLMFLYVGRMTIWHICNLRW